MLCFFCDSINHYSKNCDIHVTDKSRKNIARSKNCCEYCLTPLELSREDFESNDLSANGTTISVIDTPKCSIKTVDAKKHKCSKTCCHFCLSGIDANHRPFYIQSRDHQTCSTCFSTQHHTVYCSMRTTETSNLFLPKIDADLFQRFFKVLTVYERYLIAFSSSPSQNIWTIANLKPIKPKWFLKVKEDRHDLHPDFKYCITSNLQLGKISPAFMPTLLDIIIVKTATVIMSDLEISCHEFFQLISSSTKTLSCENVTFKDKIYASEILEKIPNILTLKMQDTNLVMDKLWLEKLSKCKELKKISMANEIYNFDPAKLAGFIESHPSRCIHFTFFLKIPASYLLVYDIPRNDLKENVLQFFTETSHPPSENSSVVVIKTKQHTSFHPPYSSWDYRFLGNFVLKKPQKISKITAAFTRVKQAINDNPTISEARYRWNKFW